MTQQASRHVDAVLAALSILDKFIDEPEFSLKGLVEATGLTHNRLLRLTGTLQAKGYMLRDPKSGMFSLGPKVLILGKALERRLDLLTLARPLLVELARNTGESVSIYVRDGLERVVLIREEGTHNIRHTVAEGQRMALYAGAAGKVLLAFSPPRVLDALLEAGPLPHLAAGTITSVPRLREELKLIRERGFASSQAERDPDAASVSAPIFKNQGELAGALSVAGPINRFNEESLGFFQSEVVRTARDLSKLLGGLPVP